MGSGYSLWSREGAGRRPDFTFSIGPAPVRGTDEPLPAGRRLHHYDADSISNTPTDPPAEPAEPRSRTPTPEVKKLEPLKVKWVDLQIKQNTVEHNTQLYDITQSAAPEDDDDRRTPQLVVRRGQKFTVQVIFHREINLDEDSVSFTFTTGENPKASKSTLMKFPASSGSLKPRDWSGAIDGTDGKEVTFTILSAPNCPIGKWNMKVDTKTASDDDTIQRYTHKQPVYVLFNPWCKDDLVYLDDEVFLDEYVLNPNGKLYTGNYKQLAGKPWIFGQFEDNVLDCSIYLLDKVGLKNKVRGDPIHVSRCIAAITNAPDDDGVLVGNWSGKYDGGTSPTKWVGSVDILKEYWKNKKPVKYGQCWVFSGLVTTICRALGLPCRSVTNFKSAHDCDGSITIDVHWDENGKPIKHLNEDSVWNFHLWNEVHMSRPDLPPGFAGWQVIDATPQETSGGIFTAGPASVSAIKLGHVNLCYDAGFIFAEVNADKVHWVLEKGTRDDWKKVIQKHAIGKKISTKRPRKAEKDRTSWSLTRDEPDREDITDQYKFKDGTEEERAVIYRANTWSSRPGEVYDKINDDVRVEIELKDGVLIGNPFDVVVKFQNTSRQERNITGTLTVWSVYYTGVSKSRIKSEPFNISLKAIKSDKYVMRLSCEDYINHIVDQASFNINVLANVDETRQVHADDEDYRLRRPDLELEVKDKAVAGKPFTCIVKFQNSMPEAMTKCSWLVEGPGITGPEEFPPQSDIEPYDKVEIKVQLIARRSGFHTITASLDSKDLPDITGCMELDIEESS